MVEVGNATYAPGNVPGVGTRHFWESFAGGELAIGAMQRSAQAQASIPPGAQTLVVNLTLVEGALVSPAASIANCTWQDDQTYLALGQTLQFGCGRPPVGNATLALAHEGSSVRVRYAIEGVVERCNGRPSC